MHLINTMASKRVEIRELKKCVKIMQGRNCERSNHISRQDNNDLWYMAEKIESIIDRIEREYEDLPLRCVTLDTPRT